MAGDGSEVKITVNANDNTASAVDAAEARMKALKAPLLKIQAQLDTANLNAEAQSAADKAKAKVKFDAEMEDAAGIEVEADKAAAEAKATIKYQSSIDAADLKAKATAAAAAAKAEVKFRAVMDSSGASSIASVATTEAEQAGEEASQSFASIFMKGASEGITSFPWLGAAIAAAVVVGTPVAAGAFALLGVAGMAALGAYLQKGNPAIQSGLTALENNFKSTFTTASTSMVQPVADGLSSINSMISNDAPDFSSMFASAAQDVKPLVTGIESLVQNALPGLKQMFASSQPIVQAFGGFLGQVGDSVSNMASTIAGDAPEISQTIHAVSNLFSNLMSTVDGVIKVTSAMGSAWNASIGTFKAVADILDGNVNSAFGDAAYAMGDVTMKGREMPSVVLDVAVQWSKMGDTLNDSKPWASAQGNMTDMASDLKTLGDDTQDTKAKVSAFVDLVEGLSQHGQEAVNNFSAAATTDLSTFAASFKNLAGAALNTDGTINDFTAKGANLQTQMASSQTDILSVAEAMRSMGDSTDQINTKVGNLDGQLETQLGKLGLTKSQSDAVIKSFGLWPNQVDTYLNVQGQDALGIIGKVGGAIAGLPSTKTINIIGKIAGGLFANGGAISKHANGSPASGLSLVGEQGPELIQAPSGSRVVPHSSVASQMAQNANASSTITMDFTGTDGALATVVMQLIRTGKIPLTINGQRVRIG